MRYDDKRNRARRDIMTNVIKRPEFFAGNAYDPYNSAVTHRGQVIARLERDLADFRIDAMIRRGIKAAVIRAQKSKDFEDSAPAFVDLLTGKQFL